MATDNYSDGYRDGYRDGQRDAAMLQQPSRIYSDNESGLFSKPREEPALTRQENDRMPQCYQ